MRAFVQHPWSSSAIWTLLAAIFLDTVGVGLVLPALPQISRDLGIPVASYGLFGSVFGICQLFGAPGTFHGSGGISSNNNALFFEVTLQSNSSLIGGDGGGAALGAWSDKIGRRAVLLVSATAGALSYLLVGLAESFVPLLVSRVIVGLTKVTMSMSNAYVTDVCAPEVTLHLRPCAPQCS